MASSSDKQDSTAAPPNASTKSERDKMLAGELYQAFDDDLLQDRQRAKDLCFQLNQTNPLDTNRRKSILKKLLPNCTTTTTNDNNDDIEIWVESPFQVDYGIYLQVGNNFYANHGCTILDCNYITIGRNCLLAPNVCISAATHPIDPTLRAAGDELTAPITIGDNVWIGANATICPGITLGNNVVVGAGAVVTKSFPDNVVIGGVPAKIIKEI